jgi:hypothetical protein
MRSWGYSGGVVGRGVARSAPASKRSFWIRRSRFTMASGRPPRMIATPIAQLASSVSA